MSNISLDLDFVGMYTLSEYDIIERLKVLKQYGITTFSIPYEILLNKELASYKERLFNALSKTQFDIMLVACRIRNYSTEYIDDKNLEDSIAYHTQFIFNTYEMLKEYNLHNNLKIVFTGGKCSDPFNISFILDKTITFFKELSQSATKINVSILLELQEKNIMAGRMIGDNWQDLSVICGAIPNSNFGILWNMANSRKNNELNNDLLLPPDDVYSRVLAATITNTALFDADRIPYNVEMQFEEIKSLIINNYNGVYHLEFVYSEIYDKRLSYDAVYDSIEYLNYILTYYTNENKKNNLIINYDPSRMQRRYIRRLFTENVSAILETNNFKFDSFELSEKYVRFVCDKDFKFEVTSHHNVVLKVGENAVELDVTLTITRKKQDEKYEYVFLIDNIDRKTKKKICSLLYLTE